MTALLTSSAGYISAALAAQPLDTDPSAVANYDEVVYNLVLQLDKNHNEAQDAALKLSRLGKRALPVLAEMLKNNFGKEKGNAQVAYYAAWALARINSGDAAKELLPILISDKATTELRIIAIKARGMEFCEEGLRLLQKIATEDADLQTRKEIYTQLSVTPTCWVNSENLFVTALSDPNDEIRALAARQCYISRIYKSGVRKLIEISEKDTHEPARVNAMLALARMQTRQSIPALVRICASEQNSAQIQLQAIRAIQTITRVSLKDSAAAQTWWKKFGEAEYAKLELPPQKSEKTAESSPDPDNAKKESGKNSPPKNPKINP
ncbi:MAG: HEAT repeat domain-containing protein [Planctomycetota bacterium]